MKYKLKFKDKRTPKINKKINYYIINLFNKSFIQKRNIDKIILQKEIQIYIY